MPGAATGGAEIHGTGRFAGHTGPIGVYLVSPPQRSLTEIGEVSLCRDRRGAGRRGTGSALGVVARDGPGERKPLSSVLGEGRRFDRGLLMSPERPTKRRPESRGRRTSRPRKRGRTDSSADVLESAQASVGSFLRSTRVSLRMTQAQVAEKTRESPWRLSRAAVSAIERGQNFPGLEAMLALSNVLHIDPKELIERARMTAVVPVDITGLSDEELENRASQFFWAGDFKRALSVYDAMADKLALEAPEQEEVVARLATLEVRRATTLKRIGALISAIARAERALGEVERLG